ncbi:MAG TPA: universal stress protein [Pyrinomonadaceae bacterium]|nr:universal stress protein [Pyrinomonadaceae bacterium]HNU07020.1 universal stress protein [Pyrinomonadaceae bacterium]
MSEKIRILIAYDGSEFADSAIDDLPRAGLPREADVMIAYVQETWLPPPSMYEIAEKVLVSSEPTAAKTVRAVEGPKADEDDVLLLTHAVNKVRSYFPDWHLETHFMQGSPASKIIRQSTDWNADLIVLGSHGTTGNRLFALGSVSQKIANEAGASVRIVRGNAWKQGSPSRIVVGLDGGETALDVVRAVARRMWTMGSEVRLVTAKELAGRASGAAQETETWIGKFVQEAQSILDAAGLSVSHVIKEGNPKTVIVEAADEWGADCIFIGASGRGSLLGSILLGSVATAIVSRANCTVEVVRLNRPKS